MEDAADHNQPQQDAQVEPEVVDNHDLYSQAGSEAEDPQNCEEDFPEEPEIADVPQLVSEGEDLNDDEASEDANVDGDARQQRNVQAPE